MFETDLLLAFPELLNPSDVLFMPADVMSK
jgi:hypothetical protein